MVLDTSAFEKTEKKYIAKASFKSVYEEGLRYYQRGRVKSVVCGKHDTDDLVSSNHILFIRVTVAERVGDAVYTTDVYDNGHMQCDCDSFHMCRHLAAAMHYIHDHLEDILSQTLYGFRRWSANARKDMMQRRLQRTLGRTIPPPILRYGCAGSTLRRWPPCAGSGHAS